MSPYKSNIGNKGRDSNRQDRLGTLGIVRVRCHRIESIMSSTWYMLGVIGFLYAVSHWLLL
jgi:hypothetical protein